jgi:hypothetical protein
MKNISFLIISLFTFCFANSQIRSNNDLNSTVNGQSAFLDASATTFSNSVNNGKGIAFPRTNLSTFSFNPANGNFLGYPTGFDGFIVYNTTTGATPATGSGIGNQDVEPGFYYFSNIGSTGSTAAGFWVRLDGGASRTEIVNNTVNNTNTIINGVPEKVVIVPGTANGTTTELVLNAGAIISGGPLNVTKLREAKVYLGNDLLMIASGDYDNGTNTLVTGDGMVNKLLKDEGADAYTVELYFE